MVFVSEARKKKGIHINKIKIKLEQSEPTKLDPKKLTDQLNAIGLYCEETWGEKLNNNIEEVVNKVGVGKLTTFGVYRDKGGLFIENIPSDKVIKLRKNNIETLNALLEKRFSKEASGEWTEQSAGEFLAKLLVIQQKDNYKYLKENVQDFPYAESPAQEKKRNVTTVEAIKDMFCEAALSCTEATVDGIDDTTLRATFSNALSTVNESSFQEDYDASNNRVITLLLNYDKNTSECDGVGIVTCEWRLRIKNYKEKKNDPRHETILNIESRSALYTDIATLNKHYDLATKKRDLLGCLCNNPIKIVPKIKVFDRLPIASMETYLASLPCEKNTDYSDALVFYSADVQKIGFVDNTLSEADASYSKSITSGFMTQTEVNVSTEINYEINAEVVKLGTTFGFNTSLTNQWSETQSETISFQVPAGKKAFLYQVTLLCARLRQDNKTGKYSYIEYGKFLTDAYKTTNSPLYEDNLD